MMNRIPYFVFLFIFFSLATTAQTLDDAIRYSSFNRMGTARGFGMGGALGSIGGDYGSLATNPAGIAMYRGSEFQLSPAFYFGNASSELTPANPNSTEADRSRFMFPSASYVSVSPIRSKHYRYERSDGTYETETHYSNWTRTVFAIGINRISNYNHKFQFNGDQNYSMTQFFIEQSDGINPDNLDAFYGGPAYDAYITAWDSNTGLYFADIDATTVVNKDQVVTQSGGLNEIALTFGADYKDKLQLGASIAFPLLRYKEKKSYTESLNGDPIFNDILFEENLTARGGGLGFKIGAKYILSGKLHISGAIHSPYWFRVTEDFDTRAVYNYTFDPDIFDQPGPREGLSPFGNFEYDYRTPWRFIGGLGYIIGRSGIVSAEVEFADLASSKFNIFDDQAYADDLNNQIDDNLGSVINLRIGGEWRIKSFRLRAGYAMSQNPFADVSDFDRNSLSFGLGTWVNRFFFDLGYRYQSIDQSYSPYTLFSGPSPVVETTFKDHNVILTVGVKI